MITTTCTATLRLQVAGLVASVGLRVSGSHGHDGLACEIACYLWIDLSVGMRSIYLVVCDMRRR